MKRGCGISVRKKKTKKDTVFWKTSVSEKNAMKDFMIEQKETVWAI